MEEHKQPTEAELLNPSFLFEEGLRHLQQLAGGSWTDHNTHDPGITILEQLSYALADLNYRTSIDIHDLLATSPNSKNEDHALFTAKSILPSQPITITDYRKLILDIEGIRNAWIFPVNQVESIYKNSSGTALSHFSDKVTATANDTLNLKGLFQVLLDFDIEVEQNESRIDEIKQEVWKRLMKHRNLGEDFLALETVKKEEISLSTQIELETDTDLEEVLAEIYYQVDKFLMPPIRFYSLEEVLDKKIPVHQVFEGPALNHGFLLTNELPVHRTSLHISDLIQLIMNVKGVKAVKNFHAASHPEGVVFRSGQRWCIRLNPDHNFSPKLETTKCKMVFLKNGISYEADEQRVDQLLAAKRQEDKNQQYPDQLLTDLEIPGGSYRNIEDFYSIRQDFPENYGISKEGLPSTATSLRKAQAKQLKAYLSLYEQIMANYQSQLANAGQLFSNQFSAKKTYFSMSTERTGSKEYYLENSAETQQGNAIDTGKRTIRFINHKLGRLAEEMGEYPMLSSGLLGDKSIDEEIKDKLTLLLNYPSISRDRGKGYNYQTPHLNTSNVSGLKKRVARLLGFDEIKSQKLGDLIGNKAEGFHIVEHLLLRPKNKTDHFLKIFPVNNQHLSPWTEDPYSHIISIIIPAWPSRFNDQNQNFRSHFEKMIHQESPSHTSVNIHWLEHDEMRLFEKAYEKWLKENAKPSHTSENYSNALNEVLNELNKQYSKQQPFHLPVEFEEADTIQIQASDLEIKESKTINTVEKISIKFTLGNHAHSETGLLFNWTDQHNYWLFHYSQASKKVKVSKVENRLLQEILSTSVSNLANADIEMTLEVQDGKWKCKQRSPDTIGTEFLINNSGSLDGLKIGLYKYKSTGTQFRQLKVTDKSKAVITKLD